MATERDPLVLVVEDDAAVRSSVVECLRDIGIRTMTEEDGGAGIDAFERDRPDLVLLDLRLPEIDGLGVLKAIRLMDAEATVIVVSGKGMMEDAVAALRLGAFDYLAKPIQDLAVLEHAVSRGLERSRLIRENREHRENLERQVAERTAELQEAYRALEAKNVALQEVLSSIEAERKRFGRQVTQNVERVILPGLRTLKAGLPRMQQRGADELEKALEEIVSPFVDKVARDVSSLTPTEIRICTFVRRGMAVKEIAEVEHLSPETIAAHRRSIRRKLGLAHRKVNLGSYLQTLFGDGQAGDSSAVTG